MICKTTNHVNTTKHVNLICKNPHLNEQSAVRLWEQGHTFVEKTHGCSRNGGWLLNKNDVKLAGIKEVTIHFQGGSVTVVV